METDKTDYLVEERGEDTGNESVGAAEIFSRREMQERGSKDFTQISDQMNFLSMTIWTNFVAELR